MQDLPNARQATAIICWLAVHVGMVYVFLLGYRVQISVLNLALFPLLEVLTLKERHPVISIHMRAYAFKMLGSFLIINGLLPVLINMQVPGVLSSIFGGYIQVRALNHAKHSACTFGCWFVKSTAMISGSRAMILVVIQHDVFKHLPYLCLSERRDGRCWSAQEAATHFEQRETAHVRDEFFSLIFYYSCTHLVTQALSQNDERT